MNYADLHKLTREELYNLVWTTPGSKLAGEYCLSDVAIAKRCKKMKVPRPPRGYWAKVAVGEKPRKLPLPPLPKVDVPEWLPLEDPVPELHLPDNNRSLHPAAAELLRMLRVANPDSEKRVKSEGKTLPKAIVSKSLIEKAAQTLHTIIWAVAARGIEFCSARSKYDTAHFEMESTRLDLSIEERIVTIKREPTAQDKRRPSWEWDLKSEELARKLTFEIGSGRKEYREWKVEGTWTESEQVPLEKLLHEVVEGVLKFYINKEKEHAQWREAQRKAEEEQAIKDQAEKKKAHEAALQQTAAMRSNDLLKGAEWYRLFTSVMTFIAECERQWRVNQSDKLTVEQETWLTWAQEAAKNLSPFEAGYPDPLQDGPFDPSAVPLGGPYPPRMDFHTPPTLPKIPPPVQQEPRYYGSSAPAPEPYPFWLKHQGR